MGAHHGRAASMMRAAVLILALSSPFLFPFPLTLLLAFTAGLVFPPMALLVGGLADLAYYAPGASVLPLGVLWGVALTVLAHFVRRGVKARIMGG